MRRKISPERSSSADAIPFVPGLRSTMSLRDQYSVSGKNIVIRAGNGKREKSLRSFDIKRFPLPTP
jgi:hypothetical protein